MVVIRMRSHQELYDAEAGAPPCTAYQPHKWVHQCGWSVDQKTGKASAVREWVGCERCGHPVAP
jgi:hypothetical protein